MFNIITIGPLHTSPRTVMTERMRGIGSSETRVEAVNAFGAQKKSGVVKRPDMKTSQKVREA